MYTIMSAHLEFSLDVAQQILMAWQQALEAQSPEITNYWFCDEATYISGPNNR